MSNESCVLRLSFDWKVFLLQHSYVLCGLYASNLCAKFNLPALMYFQENFLESFFNHDFQESGALRVIRFGDMTETSRKKLERKSLELVDLYDQLTYNDRHYRPGDRERKNVSTVIAHRTWTITPWEGFIKDKKRVFEKVSPNLDKGP